MAVLPCLFGQYLAIACKDTQISIFDLSWLTRWMAPESFFDGTWDLASDVWMFGVMLWGKMMAVSEPSVARRLRQCLQKHSALASYLGLVLRTRK